MKDKTLICADCGNEFLWSEGEQEFYAEKGLEQPKYCQICRARKKAEERQFASYRKPGHS